MANYDFKGKVLVLTGASGGIGLATARYFDGCGASMLLTYHHNEKAKALARELDPTGRRIVAAPVDISRSTECTALAERCRQQFGHCDFLVNNAAILRMASVATMTDELWREVMAANLDSVFYMCRAFLPLLRDGGAIVNIASTAAHRGAVNHSAYAATKGAVLTFSRSLAREIAPRLRCNGLSPGMVDTEMLGELPEEVMQTL
ncbi:MAG: SDR family oxidoreductase, partial [Alphaproteobacteria bacterium]|nr:SDR family oxidoreductase [Alphaproteobacteria bacterium]